MGLLGLLTGLAVGKKLKKKATAVFVVKKQKV
jgi:hypothetical protein